jgi:hypothetical protein
VRFAAPAPAGCGLNGLDAPTSGQRAHRTLVYSLSLCDGKFRRAGYENVDRVLAARVRVLASGGCGSCQSPRLQNKLRAANAALQREMRCRRRIRGQWSSEVRSSISLSQPLKAGSFLHSQSVVRLIFRALAIAVAETDCRAARAASSASKYLSCAVDGGKARDGCFGSFPLSLPQPISSTRSMLPSLRMSKARRQLFLELSRFSVAAELPTSTSAGSVPEQS